MKRRSKKNRNSANGAGKSRRLNPETLEQRLVLTGSASVLNGELIVIGDSSDNTIFIAELEDSYLVDADFLKNPRTFRKSRVLTVRATGGDGNDTLVATAMQSPVTLQGNGGDDRIFGGQSEDLIEGGAGNDLIYGNGGSDIILGGAGVDRVFAGTGDDVVNAGAGNDVIQGNDGDDTLNGELGDDQLLGSQGNDTLNGGAGMDMLFGGLGNDVMDGGIDADTLVGDADADVLTGGGGDDTLLGSGGNDLLRGGLGNDLLVGGSGNDELNGGDGADRMFGGADGDTIIGGNGDDIAFGGVGPDTILGNNGNDSLTGGIGSDVIAGHAGDDTIQGNDYQDILIGGTGNDALQGHGSQDILIPGVASNQTDPAALAAARTIWIAPTSFEQRVASVLTGVGVFPETAEDNLAGGGGMDAFFAANTVQISDRGPLEPIIAETAEDNRVIAVIDEYDLAIGETLTTTPNNGVLSNDTFPSSGSITATLLTQPAHGNITFNADGTFSYTQSTHARDSFTYRITAQNGRTAEATVRITTPILPPLPDGVTLTTTGTGLEVYDFTEGVGPLPARTDTVTVDYSGHLPDGTVFDSNMMIDFRLTGVIEGFAEGIEGMRVGGMRRIAIPPDLGYGSSGNPGAGIGGTDVITFDVTLHAINGNEFSEAELSGVFTVPVDSSVHTTDPVTYITSPPAGGDHFPVWQTCGFYSVEVPNERAVHSMEHGAVWITYTSDVSASELAVIEDLAANNTHVLSSLFPDQETPIALTAWARQTRINSISDPIVQQFLNTYMEFGPTTPEPGEACSGGQGTPPNQP